MERARMRKFVKMAQAVHLGAKHNRKELDDALSAMHNETTRTRLRKRIIKEAQ